jgi:leucyl aminopeptidase (aminopeptidase T)
MHTLWILYLESPDADRLGEIALGPAYRTDNCVSVNLSFWGNIDLENYSQT